MRCTTLVRSCAAEFATHHELRDDASVSPIYRTRLAASAGLQPFRPEQVELAAGLPRAGVGRFWANAHKPPQLVIVPAYKPGPKTMTCSTRRCGPPLRWPPAVRRHRFKGETWADIVSDAMFGADAPPRYVILAGLNEWLLLDRYKWPNNRALRFDWNDILDRKDTATLQAAAALLHRDSLAPDTAPACSKRWTKTPTSTPSA